MSTFICTRCGAIENTATSDYWYDTMENRQPVCSKCSSGKWHNMFPREHWSTVGISKILELQKRNQGDFINGRNHLRNIGVIGNKKDIVKEIPWEE